MDFKPVKSGPVFQSLCHVKDCDEMSPGIDKVQDKFYIIDTVAHLQPSTRWQTMTFFVVNFHSK
ncbi:MAG TPA: hypothetical protein DER09_03215 [Prolixibacteraceae bacterium]|nr:hypothetical protein [Prolixibacteraceae bacterium]